MALATAPASPYLDVQEAAAFAKVSPTTIRRAVRDGDLPEHRAGRQLRFRPDALTRWIESDHARKDDSN